MVTSLSLAYTGSREASLLDMGDDVLEIEVESEATDQAGDAPSAGALEEVENAPSANALEEIPMPDPEPSE
jgi:hypothetical protein